MRKQLKKDSLNILIFEPEYGINSCIDHNYNNILVGIKDKTVSEIIIPEYCGTTNFFPENVGSIAEHAFDGCYALKSVELPDDLLKYYQAFRDTPVYKDVCKRYSEYLKQRECLNEKDFSEYATELSDICKGSEKLRHVELPRHVKRFISTFANCRKLESVELPKAVEQLTMTFSGCTSLKTIKIPSKTKVLYKALEGCSSLKEVIMYGTYSHGDVLGVEPNESIERIVCLNETPTIIGSTPNATWYVPKNAIEEYKKAVSTFSKNFESDGLPNIQYKEIKELFLYDGTDKEIKEMLPDLAEEYLRKNDPYWSDWYKILQDANDNKNLS